MKLFNLLFLFTFIFLCSCKPENQMCICDHKSFDAEELKTKFRAEIADNSILITQMKSTSNSSWFEGEVDCCFYKVKRNSSILYAKHCLDCNAHIEGVENKKLNLRLDSLNQL